jgi:predicted alpha/beta hydrolase family esterase
MKNVLFLQSWYSKIDDNWYGWLKAEVEKKGYKAVFRDISELRNDTPDLEKILNLIKELNVPDRETTVVAHSLGCLVAMRLAEIFSFKKMILVSGWDYDDLTKEHELFWKTKIDHKKIKNNVKEIIVVHSDNDPYFTAFNAEEMSKRLGGQFILIPGGGHFASKEKCVTLPQLLNLL